MPTPLARVNAASCHAYVGQYVVVASERVDDAAAHTGERSSDRMMISGAWDGAAIRLQGHSSRRATARGSTLG